jgi:hypothetical protein
VETASIELANRLQKNGIKTRDFFIGLAPGAWDVQVYSDGNKWTVRHIFMHIVETELDIPTLVKRVIYGHPGVAENFDIDKYNQTQVAKVNSVAVKELIKLFVIRRAETVALVEGLSSDELNLRGRHPFLGETEIYEMLRMMILHIQLHMRDISKAI